MQFQPDFCRIPPYRNYLCRFYNHCLTAHALRDSTGFTCDGCDYEHDWEPVNPWEILGVVHLLAVVFRSDLPGLVADLDHGRGLVMRNPVRTWKQPERALA